LSKRIPKNSGKAPSIQFYYKDWLTDERLTRASKRAKGVWIDLIAISCDLPTPGVFRDENGSFSGRVVVELLSGSRRENNAGFNELVRRNIIKQDGDGTFYIKRVKRDMELRRIRRDAGKKGGNPILLNQSPNQNAKQKPTPSSSTSTAVITPCSRNNICLTKSTQAVVDAWSTLPLPPDKKNIPAGYLPAIDRALAELDQDTAEPVHHGMVLEAIENYGKALAVPNSQAHKHKLYNWLQRHVRKYVSYAFDIEHYDGKKFESKQAESDVDAEYEKLRAEGRFDE
jgi:hypothetical protein